MAFLLPPEEIVHGQTDLAVTHCYFSSLFDSEGIALVLNLSTSMHDNQVSHL